MNSGSMSSAPSSAAAFGRLAHRFLVVSAYYPPIVGGTATVMRNLLSAFRSECFAVVADSPSSFPGETHQTTTPPQVSVHRCGVPGFLARIPFSAHWLSYYRAAQIPRVERAIVAEAKAIQAGRIVAAYPSLYFLVAAYRASRNLGLPLVTYHMDVPYPIDRLRPPARQIAARWEPLLLREAARRLVLSDGIADYMEARSGLQSVVVPHSFPLDSLPAERLEADNRRLDQPPLIVHTGVLPGIQQKGLSKVISLMRMKPQLGWRLTISTPSDPAELRQQLRPDMPVDIAFLEEHQVLELQRKASVLLAFGSFSSSEAGRQFSASEFPTKIIEYLASGAPILVHSAPDSLLACHARKHGYALVVDDPAAEALGRGIERILAEAELRHSLIQAARATLRREFDLRLVARKFVDAAGIDQTCLLA